MGYYDIDDILAENTKFACSFNYEIPGLGYLEGSNGKPIHKNAKVELPFWLGNVLAIVPGDHEHEDEEPQPFVQLLAPEIFSNRVINAIKANPRGLDIHSINGHFYALAVKWATLFSDAELVQVLSDMILERAQEINSHASSVSLDPDLMLSDTTARFQLTLDEFEKNLYRVTHDSYKRAKLWLTKK
ncbi:HEL199Wp [Eremothecium sinecaudum]|uniref:DNA replication complex GINS protein PSF3 n=1 Tax=Eremothecium sinecaudum TaxID=45286 RepID=A0A0X8HT81_9SACH|nr:HEL199Wp [Eremothecium sinecaudum]AMD21082.1 HEL199Wp [Eremothecium sinecaudum]